MSFGPSPTIRRYRDVEQSADHRCGDEWLRMAPDPLGVKAMATDAGFETSRAAYRCKCGQRFRILETATITIEGLEETFTLYIDVANEAAIGHQPLGHSWTLGLPGDCLLCAALDRLAEAVAASDLKSQ